MENEKCLHSSYTRENDSVFLNDWTWQNKICSWMLHILFKNKQKCIFIQFKLRGDPPRPSSHMDIYVH